MSQFQIIENKLKHFLKRFYINELLKGLLLFFIFFSAFLIVIISIETFLWTNSNVRTVFFWSLVLFSLFLFVKVLLTPLLILLKFKAGMSYNEASSHIGSNFPEVSDVLLNLVQLRNKTSTSDLILASIEKKSSQIKHVPFYAAVNFKNNIKYLWFCGFPVVFYLISFFSGYSNSISNGYHRIVNYSSVFEPPAPFNFNILNDSLVVFDQQDFDLKFSITGSFIPENVKINFNGVSYFTNKIDSNTFSYRFSNLSEEVIFQIQGNNYISKNFKLLVYPSPRVFELQAIIDYPDYTKRTNDTIYNNGSFPVLFGSKVNWNVKCNSTNVVSFQFKDSVHNLKSNTNYFNLKKQFFNTTSYKLTTSNQYASAFEDYNYKLQIVPDDYPKINVISESDTTKINSEVFFNGITSDDYGVSEVVMMYYDAEYPNDKTIIKLNSSLSNVSEFRTFFPDTITLKPDKAYKILFRVKDNDPYNTKKFSYSDIFSYQIISDSLLLSQMKINNENYLDQFSKSLDKQLDLDVNLTKLKQAQDFKQSISYSDQQRINDYVKNQKATDDFFKKFSEHFKKQLAITPDSLSDKSLQKRYEDYQQKQDQQNALLKAIQKEQSKLDKEELQKKLDQLSKSQKSKNRSLKQLLELTKRLVVQQDLKKIASELSQLSKKQNLIEKTDSLNTRKNQKQINDVFDRLDDKIDASQKKNQSLQKPLNLDEINFNKDQLKDALQKALEKLDSNSTPNKSQQKASKQMKVISDILTGAASNGGDSPNQEDADMLRQVLDNLLTFSFNQEALLNFFSQNSSNDSSFSTKLAKQQQLREHFEHIDDSLFALSLRQPKIGELVNNSIEDVYYYIDKSIEELTEFNFNMGLSSQQYVITNTNVLSDFLSNVLDQMNNQLLMPGSGKSDMPLPDIIMSQQQLNKSLKQKSQPKNEGEPNSKGESSPSEDSQNYYDIYQEQMQIKATLESILKSKGLSLSQQNLEDTFNKIEDALINKQSLSRSLFYQEQLQYKLIQIEKAINTQETDSKRQSDTSYQLFYNTKSDSLKFTKDFLKPNDLLNKQQLPLQQYYKTIIQNYFNNL